MQNKNDLFGQAPIGNLLLKQALPAAVGILVLSIYGIVDTIFVGRYVGALGIATITVVLPISFLISSIGMSIGVGGASVISRSFGAGDNKKAYNTFGNQIGMTLTLALLFVGIGYVFAEDILRLFGGKGDVLQPAKDYFSIILIGIPFMAWAMMGNNVIRAEGYPRVAMYTLIVPAVFNIVLDPIFIIWFDMGLKGAAWATSLSYMASAMYSLWFFLLGKSSMKMRMEWFKPNLKISTEIASLGAVTLARQGTVSLLAIVLNNELFTYGGEQGLSTYGVINRVMMFANFPVLGITQGFVPIAGYNHGAKLRTRVQESIRLAIKSSTLVALIIFVLILTFAGTIVSIFTEDQNLIALSVPAMRKSFLATPLLAFSLIGSAYFQAIGKAKPALLLALSKQGIFLIPLVMIMPALFGLEGIWYAFPLADTGAAIISYCFLRKETKAL